jgi:hypothetical protein
MKLVAFKKLTGLIGNIMSLFIDMPSENYTKLNDALVGFLNEVGIEVEEA